jgi:molecular chaperone GrpE
MTDEQKEPIQKEENTPEIRENKEIPISETDNPADDNSPEISSEDSSKNEKDENKSWFEKLFQSNPSKLKEQFDELTAKNNELKDKYLRLFADFDNYKKRMAKERLELIDSAGKEFFMMMLPVIDDFERSLKAFDESKNQDALKDGVILVYQKLVKTLENKGVKVMESTGTDFNPDLHDALTEIPAPSEDKKGKVIETIEKGYYLNEKILRHAKVVVGK